MVLISSGDFEKAKKLLSDVQKTLNGVFGETVKDDDKLGAVEEQLKILEQLLTPATDQR